VVRIDVQNRRADPTVGDAPIAATAKSAIMTFVASS
jgi:hypothetical protein